MTHQMLFVHTVRWLPPCLQYLAYYFQDHNTYTILWKNTMENRADEMGTWQHQMIKNPPSWRQLIQKCKNVPICLSHQFLMSSLEEVAEKSFPPNGLLGCLCTVVSWWLQPTSSKTKVHVSKIPSQLTLIGIAVGLSCESRLSGQSGALWRGIWHQGDNCSAFARGSIQTLLLQSLFMQIASSSALFADLEKVCWEPLFRSPCHWRLPHLA